VAGLLGVALFAAGCATVGPDYRQPKAPVSQEWIDLDAPQVSSEPAADIEWWTVFNDPVLNTLVENAYQQNLPLRIAGLRILEARAQLGIAIGGRYPQTQQAGGGLTRVNASRNAPNTSAVDLNYSQYDIGFDAAWELDFWGKFRRAVESSVAVLEASIADYDDVLVALTAEVARTYVVIRTFEQRLEYARQNVKIQQRNLQITEVRFGAGAVTELDVQEARSILRNTEALIPALETGRRQAKNGLAVLLGKLPGEVDELLGSPQPIPAPPPEVALDIPAELLRRRPDIRRAERQLAAQSARIGVARADLFPHFSLFGSIGFVSSSSGFTKAGGRGGSDFSDLFDLDSFDFIGGPSVRWDIFNYGRIKNAVRAQDARFQQLAVNYENTVLEAHREVEDAVVAFVREQERSGFLGEAAKASQRSLELSQLQYTEGIVDFIRVLDASRSLVVQQDELAVSEGDIAVNLIATYKGLGGGWQIREGKDFVPEATKVEMAERTDWGQLLWPQQQEPPPAEEALHEWQWPEW
jgi:NodT family efflux transporter outer membrane factor (OMF) lipoprotein